MLTGLVNSGANRRRATATLAAVALAASAVLLPAPSEAGSSLQSENQGRWSGDWEVKGQTQENGNLVLFGVITFELLTGDAADGERLNFEGTCESTDDVYLMSWEFGGGGAGRACEIGILGDDLFGKYFGNDGSWGQFENTFVPSSSSWRGEYTPPSFNPTFPSNVWLEWEGTKGLACSAAEARGHEIGPVDWESAAPAQGPITPELGCPAGEEQTVSFIFTQGGLPKKHPGALADVRTVGKGKITFFNPDPTDTDREVFNVSKYSGRIVRELDYLVNADTDIKTRRMKFRVHETDGRFTFLQPDDEVDHSWIFLDLVTVNSNDSRCPKKTKDGPRTARLTLRESLDGTTGDLVRLTVPGCPHHNYTFTGKKRVTVAIVHKTLR